MTTAGIIVVTAAEARELTDQIKVAVEGTWQLIKQAYLTRAWCVLGYDSWDDYCTREFGTSRLRLPREERQEVVASFRDIGMSTRAIASATGVSKGTVQNTLAAGGQNWAPEPDPDVPPAAVLRMWVCKVCGESKPSYLVADNRVCSSCAPGTDLVDSIETISTDFEIERPGGLITAVETTPAPRKVTGTDGKSYPSTKAAPPPEAERTERRAPLTADLMKLSMDIYRLTNRVDKFRADDRLHRNAEQVAIRLRGDLSRAVEVFQDLLDELPALKSATTNTEESTK